MKAEFFTNSESDEKLITDDTVSNIGKTVFEKLSQEEVESIAGEIQGIESIDFTNSVTRTGDGQTVPDER